MAVFIIDLGAVDGHDAIDHRVEGGFALAQEEGFVLLEAFLGALFVG